MQFWLTGEMTMLSAYLRQAVGIRQETICLKSVVGKLQEGILSDRIYLLWERQGLIGIVGKALCVGNHVSQI